MLFVEYFFFCFFKKLFFHTKHFKSGKTSGLKYINIDCTAQNAMIRGICEDLTAKKMINKPGLPMTRKSHVTRNAPQKVQKKQLVDAKQ